jgi:multidrug efflux pump subunit AcrA (membrane-fusion protein)
MTFPPILKPCAVLALAVAFSLATVFRALAENPPATLPAVVAPGTVSAFFTADLYAKDSGYISDVKADIGDHVTKGQVLAIIDDPELEQHLAALEATVAARQEMAKASNAAIQQAKAGVEVAKRQLAGLEAERNLTQLTLKRQEGLFADKAATSQQIDETRAKAQVSSAAAEVGQAKIAASEADLHAAEANGAVAAAQVRVAAADSDRARTLLGYTKIVAPFDGVITRRLVSPGDLVQAATASRTTPLFTCQKLDVVRVFCEVPESSAAGIRAGVSAEVRLLGLAGQTIHATVTRIAGAMDPATRTMRVEIDLDNRLLGMLPGMYAQVTLSPNAAPTVAEAPPKK